MGSSTMRGPGTVASLRPGASVRGAADRPGGGPGFGPAEPDLEGAVVIGAASLEIVVDQVPDKNCAGRRTVLNTKKPPPPGYGLVRG
ncbi:hypothetical protein [Pseudonocardia ammonioxydans]|uniref:hypothetical protein n=1 Tax=Pseudonocardia ammonioxydans TaxID=260086 RepID=UPI001FEAC443|nr:hypothetical protein [Pseudonocardia ammonioxydans]